MRRMKPVKGGSLRARVLRLFGRDEGFELPMCSYEGIQAGISADHRSYDCYRKISNALLEAERRKAHALSEWQRRRFTR